MMHKRLLTMTMVLLLLLGLLAGCEKKALTESSNLADAYKPAETMPAATTAPADFDTSLDSGSNSPENAVPAYQKLIRKIYLDAETEDMDALLEAVYRRVTELGGYIENRNIYNGSAHYGSNSRYADLTIRIPADRLDRFVEAVSGVSNITSNRETTEDVTLSYVATESRIIALETEYDRLLVLLEKAEKLEDLLTIESRLTNVRGELEQVKSQLRVYDNLVNYGTVYLDISEVREYTIPEPEPETVWQRISTGFVKSLKGLWTGITEIFVFLVVALPYLAVIGLLAFGLILLIRRKSKKRVKKPIQTAFDPEKKEE